MPLQRWQTMLEEPPVDGFEEGFFAVETCTLAVLLTSGAGGVATGGEDFSILIVDRGGKDLPALPQNVVVVVFPVFPVQL